MATYTPNLNLRKPLTGEYYDAVADHNDAMDKIDRAIGDRSNYYTPEMFGGTDWIHCQKAVDAAGADGGGVVIFKAGSTYTLDSNTIVVWGSNVKLIAYGAIINCVGSPGNYGGAILVIGKNVGTEYYGYLNGDNYASRVAYAGAQETSDNVILAGFNNFVFDASLTDTAMNGISVGNCKNTHLIDCNVKACPQTAYAAVATYDEEIDVTLENCRSDGSKGHPFRIITSNTTPNTKVTAVLKNCKAGNTVITNPSAGFITDLGGRTDVDLYLRGTDLGDRFNVKLVDCDFEGGVYHPSCGGKVIFDNLKCKYFNQNTGATGANGQYISMKNIRFTGTNNPGTPSLDACLFLKNIFGIVEIDGVTHPYSADDTKIVLAVYTAEKLSLKNMQKGKVQFSADGSNVSDILIKKSHIWSTSGATISAPVNSKITIEDCELSPGTYFTGSTTAFYSLIKNLINRSAPSSSYMVMRNMAFGSVRDNKMVISGTALNTEQVAIPTSTITVNENLIIQPDGTAIVDYGGKSTGAPTTGYHRVGQFTNEQTPVAGGYLGYICVAAGTPGTWKGFGLIQV